MGGGLMQLVAYGAQDIYLTGNAQITLFKIVYRRHTNFSMESIEHHFSGTPDFGKIVAVTVSRDGDLMSQVYLQVSIPEVNPGANTFGWNNELGHFLIKSCDIEIGGQLIDRHYGTWLSIWSALTITQGHISGYNNMIGNISSLTPINTVIKPSAILYIPLQFWFNRNPGLALPLIALQYHEVKFNFAFADLADLKSGTDTSTPAIVNASLWIDYMFLDTDERRRFAQTSHEYLMEQVQFTGNEPLSGTSNNIKLNFNHPVKEIAWVIQGSNSSGNNYTDVSGPSAPNPILNAGANPTSTAKITLNGHDRFTQREGKYFNWIQPYQHHTSIPDPGINVYSFSIYPEEHQPSGTINMSRIDSAILHVDITSAADTNITGKFIKVYAVNYNVLRIMSGMAGLTYSN